MNEPDPMHTLPIDIVPERHPLRALMAPIITGLVGLCAFSALAFAIAMYQ